MSFKFGMQHRVLKYYQIPSNEYPGLTLTYFMTRSNLIPYAFVWGKGKTIDFSEIIVVYDLKLATDDQSDKSFCWHQNFVPWGLYAPCPGATKVPSNGHGHMTKMAAMPIYGKTLKNLLLWNQKADDL